MVLKQEFSSIDHRSLVSRLEEVDPRKMKHEEKLAFWINVHNALVMHVIVLYIKFHWYFSASIIFFFVTRWLKNVP